MNLDNPFRGQLIADGFLCGSIVETEDWQSVDDGALESLGADLRALFDRFPADRAPNEPQTETDLIHPVLERLGWEAKAEWIAGRGANPRFVVTSLSTAAIDRRDLYEQLYCARGDMENRIKECQLDLFADRTSAQTMRANQLCLRFAAMAYVLLAALRRIALAAARFRPVAALAPAVAHDQPERRPVPASSRPCSGLRRAGMTNFIHRFIVPLAGEPAGVTRPRAWSQTSPCTTIRTGSETSA